MRYAYKVTSPLLPPDCKDHMDSYRNVEWWLNDMDSKGWEFVGHAEKHWNTSDGPHTQSLWIFRKPRPKKQSKQAQ